MPKSKVLEFRPIAKIHLDELKAIWPADPRIPSPASRRAWSLARKISPARVNSWWYNRKREAKRLRIKIPRREEYELPIGEPPDVPEDCASVKEEAVDENISLGATEPRGDANPPRLRSGESVDVPLNDVRARKPDFVDLSLEWASDSGMLDYASSDTACSPAPESGSVDYTSNGTVEWGAFGNNSIQVVSPSALDPAAIRARQSVLKVKLRLDDYTLHFGSTGKWSAFGDNSIQAVFSEDFVSPNALDSAAIRTRNQSVNKVKLQLADFTSNLGRTDEWNSIQMVSTEDSVPLDSAANRICNQGVTASEIPQFTCPLCVGDCIPPINDGLSLSDAASSLTLVTNAPHAVACSTEGVFALEIRRDYIRLYDRYYTRDGWLLDADDLDHSSDMHVDVDPAFPFPS